MCGKFASKEAKKTIQLIKKACVEVGFFQVIGHGLKNEEIKIFVLLEINFSIWNINTKENYLLKNGINKIKIFIEAIFPMMLMEKRV